MCFKSMRSACLFFTALLTVSCVEDISLDPMEEMPVVVTCVLTTETTEQSLDLFYAKRPSETGYVSIPDAQVVVREDAAADGTVHEFKWNGVSGNEKYSEIGNESAAKSVTRIQRFRKQQCSEIGNKSAVTFD